MRATIIIAIAAFVLLMPSATAGVQTREWSEDVWVAWSASVNEVSEADLEKVNFEMRSGHVTAWGLALHNDGAADIKNVTLVIARTAGVAGHVLGDTFAGDEPQLDYAFWPHVAAGGERLVIMELAIANVTARSDFLLDILVLYESEGVQKVAKTHITGVVVPPDRSLMPLPWVLVLPAVVGVALIRRSTARGRA